MHLITTKKLTKDYIIGDTVTSVLRGVDLIVDAGEFVAIMGPSGSGKSTLMHILGFLDRQTAGVYEFEGRNTQDFNDDYLAELRNRKVGFVFQSFNLLKHTTVLDNVLLPLMYAEIPQDIRKSKAEHSLESVGLADRINYFTNQISGGEQQRVAIARALVNNPIILFADEPTGNLDSKSGGVIMGILQDLNNAGRTIIMVTHESDTATHAKRIIRMKDGLIIADEPVRQRVYANLQRELVK